MSGTHQPRARARARAHFFWISANARAQFFDGRTKALLSRHKMPTVRSNSSHMLAWLYGGEYERGTSLGP